MSTWQACVVWLSIKIKGSVWRHVHAIFVYFLTNLGNPQWESGVCVLRHYEVRHDNENTGSLFLWFLLCDHDFQYVCSLSISLSSSFPTNRHSGQWCGCPLYCNSAAHKWHITEESIVNDQWSVNCRTIYSE